MSVDITITLRAAGDSWLLGLDGPSQTYTVDLRPLDDAIPAEISGLDESARRWSALPEYLAPTVGGIQPPLSTIKSLGALLRRALLGPFGERLSEERRKHPHHRLLFEVVDRSGGGVLAQLPLEIIYDEDAGR